MLYPVSLSEAVELPADAFGSFLDWSPCHEEVSAAADYALDGTARHSFRPARPRTIDRNGFDCLTGGDWLSEWRQMHLRSRA